MIDNRQTFINFSRRDVREALPDFLCLRHGVRVEQPHPVAQELAAIRELALPDLAAHVLGRFELEGAELHRTVTGADFQPTLAAGLQAPLNLAYAAAAAPLDAVLTDITPKGYKPVQLPVADWGQLEEIPASGLFATPPLSIDAGVSIAPAQYGAAFTLSRELLVNDPLAATAVAAMRGYGSQAARIEARLAAQALDATTLDAATAVVSGGVSAATLEDAEALLAAKPVAGADVAGLTPAAVICHPSAAMSVRISLVAAGLAWKVIPCAWIDSSKALAYLLAAPQISPVLIRSRLSAAPAVLPRPVGPDTDATGFQVTYSTAVAVADTTGLVRLTA